MTGLLVYLTIGFILSLNSKINDQQNIGTMLIVTLLWPVFVFYFAIGLLCIIITGIAVGVGVAKGKVTITRKEKNHDK